jgi:hypothetical protein
MARLQELVRLPVGWDGYDAGPVLLDNVVFALSLLDSLLGPNGIPPQIVPSVDGDLQLEWHSPAVDIELHIIAPNNVQAWIVDGETGEETELKLTFDFRPLTLWFRKLVAEAAIAA